MKKIYVLRCDNYNEWAQENGACDLIGVYESIYLVKKELDKCLSMEKEQGYVVEEIDDVIETLEKKQKVYIDVYTCKYGYDNGSNIATYVIEARTLNNTNGQ